MNLPGNATSLLNYSFHLSKLDTIVIFLTMNLELFFSLEGFATLGARHLEGRFELDILVSIHFHLLGVVRAILFLSDFMLSCLSVLF